MKKVVVGISVMLLLSACSPEMGSEQWCTDLKDKTKSDWTAEETKNFTKHCIF